MPLIVYIYDLQSNKLRGSYLSNKSETRSRWNTGPFFIHVPSLPLILEQCVHRFEGETNEKAESRMLGVLACSNGQFLLTRGASCHSVPYS